MIPYDATPKEFAERVEYANNLSPAKAAEIIERNFTEIIPLFDRKRVAQDFIDLINLKPCGYFKSLVTGTLTDEVREGSNWIMKNKFGPKLEWGEGDCILQ